MLRLSEVLGVYWWHAGQVAVDMHLQMPAPVSVWCSRGLLAKQALFHAALMQALEGPRERDPPAHFVLLELANKPAEQLLVRAASQDVLHNGFALCGSRAGRQSSMPVTK